MPYLTCYVDLCRHNQDRRCQKKNVSINWRGTNEFDRGERVCYPVCEDFEEAAEGEEE